MDLAVFKAIEDLNNAVRWQSELLIDMAEAHGVSDKLDVLELVGTSKGSVVYFPKSRYPNKEAIQNSFRGSAKQAGFKFRFAHQALPKV